MQKGIEFLLSDSLYLRVPSLILTFKFKTAALSPRYSTFKFFGYMPQKDLPNPPPSFIAQRPSIKRFVA